MPILHLGVIDLPYVEVPAKPSRRRKKPKGSRSMTTGDVAEILEHRYHVMELFWQLHEQENVIDLEESLAGSIEGFIMGAPVSLDPFGSATSKIEDRFKQMLSTRELDSLGFPGIPTAAAQRGVNHRLKRPYKKRAARPSFIDRGLYQSSFKSWVE